MREDRNFIFDIPYEKNIKYYIKCLLYSIMRFVYMVLLLVARGVYRDKKYRVTICAIFKNEDKYIKEWIEFHHLIGVDHFYMYNNNSTDDYMVVLGEYIESGLVTLVDWPYNQKQMEAYKDCIKKHKTETEWLGFIDLDEYVIPKSVDNIYDYLKKFKSKPAVLIYWKLFGTSGLMIRDESTYVTEKFTVCWPKYCDVGKCFYNTAFGFDDMGEKNKSLHHMFWGNWHGVDLPPVNIFGKVVFGNKQYVSEKDFPIQINHYFTKSFTEYIDKASKGDVYFKNNPHDLDYFYEHEEKCMSVDYSAYKYLIKLKVLMNKRVR